MTEWGTGVIKVRKNCYGQQGLGGCGESHDRICPGRTRLIDEEEDTSDQDTC